MNPGTGAKMQIAALGAQDAYLRGTWSPFTEIHKRATMFSTWASSVDMPYTPGKRSQIDVPKAGDLLADVYLEITLPAVGVGKTWNACVGYLVMRRVRLILDQHEIHNIERLWYDIYDALHTAAGHEAGLARMVGREPLDASVARTLHIPLRFMTCGKGTSRAPLPLYARTDLKLDIEFETPDVLMPGFSGSIGVAAVFEFVGLDDRDAAYFKKGVTLACESVIDSDGLNYKIDSDADVRTIPMVRVNLGNVRFAVKALVWVAYVDGTYFTYLDGALGTVVINFNGQQRIAPRRSGYFGAAGPQRYVHFTKTARAADGIGVYAFALNASSRKPSGAADLGALTEASLHAEVAAAAASSSPEVKFKVKVFSVYYNFVEITPTQTRLVYM
jgi:hypothetical protein